jgi:hypothetical protein
MKRIVILIGLIIISLTAKSQYFNLIDDYNGKGYIKASNTAIVFRFMSGEHFYIDKGDLMQLELENDSIVYLVNCNLSETGNDINGWSKKDNYSAIKATYVSVDTLGNVLSLDCLKRLKVNKVIVYTSKQTIESELDKRIAQKFKEFVNKY